MTISKSNIFWIVVIGLIVNLSLGSIPEQFGYSLGYWMKTGEWHRIQLQKFFWIETSRPCEWTNLDLNTTINLCQTNQDQ